MRRHAEEITAAEPGLRLPVPQADDEVARLGGTLNLMLDRLEDALRHERTFVIDASHELRGPLAILKAELELAQRAPQSREALELTIRSASEETERLTQLAEDLLVIARGEQGHLPIDLARVDAGQLLRDVRDRVVKGPLGAARNIRVSSCGGRHLRADRAKIERALGNLVENALRYGGGDVTLSAVLRNGTVELHVYDEGRGFSPDFLPNAFGRFTRADAGRSTDGAGLGLSIVAAIAASHGGAAHAANRTAGGADVWISLPVTE